MTEPRYTGVVRTFALAALLALSGCSLLAPLDGLSSGCGEGCACTRDDHCAEGEACVAGACTATCGDGVRAASEPCDDGDANGPTEACLPSCEVARCGDGLVLSAEAAAASGLFPEACDDGNAASGDGCAGCVIEPGWACDDGGCEPVCGDGVRTADEACDDGGQADDDGCASTCEVELGWACVGEPSVCAPVCGDGTLHGDEACDDGGTDGGDGCSAACALEPGWLCSGAPTTCSADCGDGLIVGPESCDDANDQTGDGCGQCQAVVSLDVGGFSACALLSDGRVKCWGGNGSGQLGLGDTLSRGGAPGELGPALPTLDLGTDAGGAPLRAVELALGLDFACARLEDGRVKCWGGNAFGQLGLGDTEPRGDQAGEMGDALPFVDLGTDGLGSPLAASSLAAGGHTACAVLATGTLRCWGRNDLGQLGLGDTDDRGDEPGEMGDQLAPPSLLGAVAEVAVGYVHTCARGAGGEVWCWGAGAAGQLGNGGSSDVGDQPGEMGASLLPLPFPPGFQAVGLSLGATHSCALGSAGDVRCWGDGALGRLGAGGTATIGDQPGELAAQGPVALGSVGVGPFVATAISAGGASTCALTQGGAARCWGSNNAAEGCPAGSGVLGAGAVLALSDQPGEVGNGLPLLDLGAGASIASLRVGTCSACALLADARVKCWGRNDLGQLALGDAATRGDQPGEMGDALGPAILP